MTSDKMDKHTVHWFRKGLRLHDNPSLREGLKSATTFRCIFIIDPWFAGSSNDGINKWRFLLQCLEDLDKNLRQLNSRLFVIRGQPADALPKLFKEWKTTSLTFEEDPEPFGKVRDQNISTMCKEFGISVVSRVSHTLYKLEKIIDKNGGRAPLTYHQFQTVIAGMEAPSHAEAAITANNIGDAMTPIDDDHDDKYGVPTLEELGFDTEGLQPPVWVGGESEALARLEKHLERKALVASFGRPKMTPQSLYASQTGLSPYLRFGCLSTRLFYYQLTDLYKKIKKARPPLSLHGQLLWREFFYCAATKNPNFDKMEGNPICVQIPWDKNNEALAKWANGQTGFPWIDAIMVQLREEGWIHHLARHAVACFLTRGDLWISWEEGMKVFEELLLDADWSVNAGTWMWLSCSSFFQQFFHCYCPVRFGLKADPRGEYIKKYIPILRNLPLRYIHSPWSAPLEVQESAQCVIGRDYPLPMVDHTTASRFNIQRIKQVYRKLAKYKPQPEENGKNNLIQSLIMDNLNRSNMPVSSPSPNTVITYVNQSNYLCSTTPENKAGENTMYQQNYENTQNENNINGTNKKFNNEYSSTKTSSDLFNNNNNTGLPIRNMPFKKIIIIDQNFKSIKEEHNSNEENKKSLDVYENDILDKYKQANNEINHNYEKKEPVSFYMNRDESDQMDNDNKIGNMVDVKMDQYKEENQYMFASCSKSQDKEINIVNGNNNQSYDTYRKPNYFTTFESMKSSLSQKLNYKMNNDGEISCEKENMNTEISYLDNTQINRNYDYNMTNHANYQSKIINITESNNYCEPMKPVEKHNFEVNSECNVKEDECSLEEEKNRFQQGKTIAMQGCSRPNI